MSVNEKRGEYPGVDVLLRHSNTLFAVIVLIILVAPFFSLWLYYSTSKSYVDEQFFQLVEATAVMSASQVDPEVHARLVNNQETEGDDYEQLMDVLVSLHLSEPLIYYLNTLIERDNEAYIVLDTANELLSDVAGNALIPSDFMEHYPTTDEEDILAYEAARNGEPYVFRTPYTDEFGTFVGACAPIDPFPNADSSMVCVDIRANDYQQQVVGLRNGALTIAAITAALSLALVWGLMRIREYVKVSVSRVQQQRNLYLKRANTDPLTGALNRRAFTDEFASALADLRRHEQCFSVISLDVDYFKRINDTYGHDTGDKVLVSLVRHISRNLRESDRLARMGGEEFNILCRMNNAEQAGKVAEKLRSVVENISDVTADNGDVVRFTASIGVYVATPEDTMASVLKYADEALYEAKGSGRNRVVMRRPAQVATSVDPGT